MLFWKMKFNEKKIQKKMSMNEKAFDTLTSSKLLMYITFVHTRPHNLQQLLAAGRLLRAKWSIHLLFLWGLIRPSFFKS